MQSKTKVYVELKVLYVRENKHLRVLGIFEGTDNMAKLHLHNY